MSSFHKVVETLLVLRSTWPWRGVAFLVLVITSPCPVTKQASSARLGFPRVLQGGIQAEFESPQSRSAPGADGAPGDFGQGEGVGDEGGVGYGLGDDGMPAWDMGGDGDDGFGGDDDDVRFGFGGADGSSGMEGQRGMVLLAYLLFRTFM